VLKQDIYLFDKVIKDFSLVEEAMTFDARSLEATDGVKISQYCIALAQYLIYFTSTVNKTRADINSIKRFMDVSVNVSLTNDLVKKYKTKAAAAEQLIMNDPILSKKREEVDALSDELVYVEGINKSIDTLIATFKRELTRRENELHSTRQERKY
jgi:hypothetical protein